MFERYTEKARRTIFFGRFEAAETGSPEIATEHLLLGLLREQKGLLDRFAESAPNVEDLRREIAEQIPTRTKGAHGVDLPLSRESKSVLAYGAEEADQLGHRHIGVEHLFLGLLREEGSLAARLLRKHGIELEPARARVAATAQVRDAPSVNFDPVDRKSLHALIDTLPEGAVSAAGSMLRRMQTWPLEVAPEIAERWRQRERLGMSGQIGGSWIMGSGEMGEGSRFSSRTEDGALIRETREVFHGHVIAMVERFKMSEDGRQIKYSQQLRGPKREHQLEIDFDLG